MIELTPNKTPKGESCGTCRFAATHTCAEGRQDQVVVACRRFPPTLMERRRGWSLRDKPPASEFPHTTWDDWCGEWEARDPDPDAAPEPIGFGGGQP